MARTFSNQQAYTLYHRDLGRFLADPIHPLPAEIDSGPWFASIWMGRYQRRHEAIAGSRERAGLADVDLQRRLITRWRGRDVSNAELGGWDATRSMLIDMSYAHMHEIGQLDVGKLAEPHGFGPSLRALWQEARRLHADDSSCWKHVLGWAQRRPPNWDAKAAAAALKSRKARVLRWEETKDSDIPWACEVNGVLWRVRINDFPDEPAYSLLIGDRHIADFQDWPLAWGRGAEPIIEATVPAAPPIVVTDPDRLPDRYRGGAHAEVWAELLALGPVVREKRYLGPANEVAHETMRRVRHNIELLIPRLDAIGYKFGSPKSAVASPLSVMMGSGQSATVVPLGDLLGRLVRDQGPVKEWPGMNKGLQAGLARLQESLASLSTAPPRRPPIRNHLRDPNVFLPASRGDGRLLARLERRGAMLPLSVRAFMEEVGRIDLTGQHDVLSFVEGRDFPDILADPLAVIPTSDWVEELVEGRVGKLTADEPDWLFICPNAADKAKPSDAGGDFEDGYGIDIPEPAVDARLRNAAGSPYFVDYLRCAFAHGGFPGGASRAERPDAEIGRLTQGFAAF